LDQLRYIQTAIVQLIAVGRQNINNITPSINIFNKGTQQLNQFLDLHVFYLSSLCKQVMIKAKEEELLS